MREAWALLAVRLVCRPAMVCRGSGRGQLAAEPGAAFQQRIVGTELGGHLQQRQAEQGEGGGVDQGASQA
jgi:hypothetical protein